MENQWPRERVFPNCGLAWARPMGGVLPRPMHVWVGCSCHWQPLEREGSQDLGALGAGTQVQHCSPLLLSAPQQSLLVACILGTDYYVLFPLPTQRAKPKDTSAQGWSVQSCSCCVQAETTSPGSSSRGCCDKHCTLVHITNATQICVGRRCWQPQIHAGKRFSSLTPGPYETFSE